MQRLNENSLLYSKTDSAEDFREFGEESVRSSSALSLDEEVNSFGLNSVALYDSKVPHYIPHACEIEETVRGSRGELAVFVEKYAMRPKPH